MYTRKPIRKQTGLQHLYPVVQHPFRIGGTEGKMKFSTQIHIRQNDIGEKGKTFCLELQNIVIILT